MWNFGGEKWKDQWQNRIEKVGRMEKWKEGIIGEEEGQ